MSKKVFLVGKVHEVEPATIMIVHLDRLTGEHKVKLAANMVSEDEIEFTFCRSSLQKLVEPDMINTADADIITGEGLDDFSMAEPIPTAPFGDYFNCFIDQQDFIDCYKKSARALGASRMKDIKLDITPDCVKLTLVY